MTTPSVADKPRNDLGVALLFLLPSLIGFLAFFLIPGIRGVYLSLTDWNLLANTGDFIGLENYQEMMSDPVLRTSIVVTAYYVVLNIGSQTIFAIAIATLMDRFTKSVFVRGALILPWLVPNVVVALLWLWMLDPNVGIVNAGIEALGFEPIRFLGSTAGVIPTIAGINTWRHMGYTALLIYAGLQTIPKSLYEAASVDGSSEWHMFRKITLPLLRPVLALVLVITVVGSFQVFDIVAVATGGFGGRPGGPVNASRVIYLYIFENAFSFNRLGFAAALAVGLLLLLLTVTAIQLKLLRASESDLA